MLWEVQTSACESRQNKSDPEMYISERTGETAPSKSSPQNQSETDIGATSKQTTVSQYQFSLGSPSATLNQL